MKLKKSGPANRKPARRKVITALALLSLCAALAVSGLLIYKNRQLDKVPGLSFQEALEYTTKNRDDAVITVGVIQDGKASYTVYGANRKELLPEPHIYEIGSLTKTFTAAMVNRAIREGKMEPDASVDRYIPLPAGNDYPTIEELLTHTSGYKGYYFEWPMAANFLRGRNSFYGITREMVVRKAGKLSLPEEYGFRYSNYGYALLGVILENVYGGDFKTLMNQFLQAELKLSNTQISEQNGDLGNDWDWNADDAYLSAGAVTSDINDMLAYAQMLLDQHEYLAGCQVSLKTIDASTEQYKKLGIHMDEIGMAWIMDNENHIIWHNGGTGDYNSYLGFDPRTGTAVVVLSNLPSDYRLPATVLGVKVFQELRR